MQGVEHRVIRVFFVCCGDPFVKPLNRCRASDLFGQGIVGHIHGGRINQRNCNKRLVLRIMQYLESCFRMSDDIWISLVKSAEETQRRRIWPCIA